MKSIAAVLVLLAGAEDGPPGAADEQRRQAEVAILAPAKARQLVLTSGGARANLHEEPLLRWSNPTAGSVYGEVFLWSLEGRPAALASVYRWYHPFTDSTVEFTSIGEPPITARDGDVSVWDSASSGVSFKPLDGVRAPSASATPRLAQMKLIAREFSAQLLDERGGDQVERELRLLTQPVHRYDSARHGILDGGLFALVEGTDPEAWVLIEAIQDDGERSWRYALARMNTDALQVRRQGTVVQAWGNIHQAWRIRKAPYTLFTFDPGLVQTQKETP
jgi:hypothetical protein